MLQEVHAASSIIQQAAHDEANIIFGAVLDENMKDQVKITVIATGFKPETMRSLRRIEQPAPEPVTIGQPIHTATLAHREPVVWQGITPGSGTNGGARHDDLEVPTFLRMKS
jgi:cell division protein FtsZ